MERLLSPVGDGEQTAEVAAVPAMGKCHSPRRSVFPMEVERETSKMFIGIFLGLFISRERERERASERERDRERDRESREGAERGRERVPSRLHAVTPEPDAGLEPANCEIMI